jgi:uncharacterized protein YdeI (YjbR/CyaY-like superfamily)
LTRRLRSAIIAPHHTGGPVTTKTNSPEPTIAFEHPGEWDAWLESHGSTSAGIWMRLARKGAALQTISYAQALEVALCHGWIDAKKMSYDGESWIQRFTPRGPRSIWSMINRQSAERLIEDGRMLPAGLAAVEVARRNGRWDAAYVSQSKATVPDDLRAALAARPAAEARFATLDSRNRFVILHRVTTAVKPETRASRIEKFVAMLERGETLYP